MLHSTTVVYWEIILDQSGMLFLYWITLVDISLEILDHIRIEYLPPNTTSKLQHILDAQSSTIYLDFIEKYPTLESRQYHTNKADVKVHKFAPDVQKAMTFMTSAQSIAIV